MGNTTNYANIDAPYDENLSRVDTSALNTAGSVDLAAEYSSGENVGSSAGLSTVNSADQVASGTVSGNNFDNIWLSSWLKSRNYSPKTRGFLLDGTNGYIECMKLFVGNGGIVGGSLDIPDVGSTNSFHVDSNGNTWWGANINSGYSLAPAYVLNNGTAKFTKGLIGGFTLTDNKLTSTGLEINSNNSTINVGSGNDLISIDGDLCQIKSSNYTGGAFGSGFIITPDLMEVGNISARGMIKTAVFQKDVVSAIGGSFAILDADVLDSNMSSLDNETLTLSGTTTFQNGDILRIKDGEDDEWFEITDDSNQPIYSVTRDLSDNYTEDQNPEWKKGAAVVNYKQAANSGAIYLSSSDTNSPKLQVFTHNNSPWNDVDTKVLLGNLKDKTGRDEYGLWVKGESVYIGGYKTYDAIASKNGSSTEVYYAGQVFTSIKACIDYAETSGEDKIVIFIKNGTYSEEPNVTYLTNDGWDINVYLIGENRNNVIINIAPSGSASNARSWKFDKNLSLSSISMTGSGTYGPIIHDSTSGFSSVNITDCSFTNNQDLTMGIICFYGGIDGDYYIGKCSFFNNYKVNSSTSAGCIQFIGGAIKNVLIEKNIFRTKASGITTNNCVPERIRIENNVFGMDNYVSSPARSISFGNLKNSKINGNIIFNINNNSNRFDYGIIINGNNDSLEYNQVIGNIIIGPVWGIETSSGGITIQNNIIYNTNLIGINVFGSGINSAIMSNITNNTFFQCGEYYDDGGGIKIRYSNHSIQGNSFYKCGNAIFDGVNEGDSSSLNRIAIYNNYAIDSYYGIRLSGLGNTLFDCVNFNFSNNVIINTSSRWGTCGIQIGGFQNININNNTISGFGNCLGFYKKTGGTTNIKSINISNNYLDSGSGGLSINYNQYNPVFDGFVMLNNLIIGSVGIYSLPSNNDSGIYNRIQDNSISGGMFISSNFFGVFSGNYIKTDATSWYMNPVSFSNAVSGVFDSNVIKNGSTTSSLVGGVFFLGNSGTSCSELSINNNHIYVQGVSGYSRRAFYFGGAVTGCTISGNSINCSGNSSIIYANNNFIGNSVTGNLIETTHASFTSYGIEVNNSFNNNIINGNRFNLGSQSSSSKAAIKMWGGAIQNIFSSNHIGLYVQSQTQDGFSISGTSSGNIFNSNLRI